jgi:hypothetical protein
VWARTSAIGRRSIVIAGPKAVSWRAALKKGYDWLDCGT